MAQLWEVVGGTASGGILVREGKELSSAKVPERLSTGALVKELALEGERLHFQRLTGSGPETGWVGIVLSGKSLVVKTDKQPPAAPEPVSNGGGYTNGTTPGVAAVEKSVKEEQGAKEIAPTVDEALKQKFAAAAKDGAVAFDSWCFKYKVPPFKFPVKNCKLRIICFHMAGSAESVWTGIPNNDLWAWVKKREDAELIAMSYPGRDKLVKESPHETTDSLVEAMLPVLYDKIVDGVPYVIVSHSVGTWVAFDFLMLARKIGLPMPKAAFFNGFAAPHLPVDRRPWRVSRHLSSEEMQDEVRAWDPDHFGGAAKIVFDKKEWELTWDKLMRADFKLFDEYEFKHSNEPKFDFPIFSFHFGKEQMIKPEMQELWKDWTNGAFSLTTFDEMGHLTCAYLPKFKKLYTAKMAECLADIGV